MTSATISIVLLWLTLQATRFITSLHISDDIRFILRQKRKNHSMYQNNATEIPVSEKFQYLSNFAVFHEKWLQGYNDNCDMALNEVWSDHGQKSILSGGTDSFQMNTTWRNKICNFFKYLDCMKEPDLPAGTGRCKCASPAKVGMKLYFDPYIDYSKMFDPDCKGARCTQTETFNKNKRKFRFWCRANKGGLCGYVRLLPNKTLPGIDIPYPDIFPCLTYPYNEKTDNLTSAQLDWKGRPEPTDFSKKGLICDHRQLDEDDVDRLKVDDPHVDEGLDIIGEKIHAFICRDKVDGE